MIKKTSFLPYSVYVVKKNQIISNTILILSNKLTSDARSAIMEIDIAQTSTLSPFQLFDDILQSESRLSKQYVCFGDEEDNMADCY